MKERQKEVLNCVVDNFIASGVPISSKMLLNKSSISLSSASIRQIFSKLETNGFLKKIHISSGRVPTDMGYRTFVDHFCQNDVQISLEKYIDQKKYMKKFCQLFDKILSNLSDRIPYILMAIFTLTPFENIDQIKFFKINSYYGLLILYHRSGLISEVYIEFDHDISDCDTDVLMSWVNQNLTTIVEKKLSAERHSFSENEYKFLKLVINKVSQFKVRNKEYTETLVKNISNCFKLPDFTSKVSMQKVIDVIDDKQTVLQLLSSVLDQDELNIFIGSEMKDQRLHDFSLVGIPIKLDNTPVGCLGVFGPSRMDYISIINLITSKQTLAEVIRV